MSRSFGFLIIFLVPALSFASLSSVDSKTEAPYGVTCTISPSRNDVVCELNRGIKDSNGPAASLVNHKPKFKAPVSQVSVGGYHVCAIDAEGLKCWGTDPRSQEALKIPAGNYRYVSAGGFHTCAITRDHVVRCWGKNDLGQTDVPGFQKDPGIRVIAGFDFTIFPLGPLRYCRGNCEPVFSPLTLEYDLQFLSTYVNMRDTRPFLRYADFVTELPKTDKTTDEDALRARLFALNILGSWFNAFPNEKMIDAAKKYKAALAKWNLQYHVKSLSDIDASEKVRSVAAGLRKISSDEAKSLEKSMDALLENGLSPNSTIALEAILKFRALNNIVETIDDYLKSAEEEDET